MAESQLGFKKFDNNIEVKAKSTNLKFKSILYLFTDVSTQKNCMITSFSQKFIAFIFMRLKLKYFIYL